MGSFRVQGQDLKGEVVSEVWMIRFGLTLTLLDIIIK